MTYHSVDPVHGGFFATVQVNYSPSNSIVCYLGYTSAQYMYITWQVIMLSVTQIQLAHCSDNVWGNMVATSLHSSTRMKKRSNLDMMGAVMLMFCWRERRRRREREERGRERKRRAEGEKVEREGREKRAHA